MNTENLLRLVRTAAMRLCLCLAIIGLLTGCMVSPAIRTQTPALPTAIINTIVPTNPGLPGSETSQPVPATSPALPGNTPPVNPPLPSTPQDTPQATSTEESSSRTSYQLDAVFDYYQHTLSVSETVRYVNSASESLPEIVMEVEPSYWHGGFTLNSIKDGNGEVIDQYTLQDEQLHIPLASPLVSGAELTLRLDYLLSIPQNEEPAEDQRPVAYGYTTRQTNIVDWYPYIPPYRPGEGWLAHPYWFYGEHQVFEIADFQVKLTLAEPVEDLVIAASAPAQQDGLTYIYSLDHARSFALSASDQYKVETIHVGNVDIYSYAFPYDQYASQEVIRNTGDALQLYSALLMPYPHASLSVVEADFLDGMEYDGLYFLSHGFYDLYNGTPEGYLTFIAAHETAHQWWYGMVGNDQALEPWLDEALSTYMERVFYEKAYPDYRTDKGQSLVDWWWFYRVNFYEPVGFVDGAIYDFQGFYPYRNAVYLVGAKFLEDLRSLVGDKVFFAFLKDYAQRNKYHIATGKEFFTILREHTDADLTDLLAEYFKNAK